MSRLASFIRSDFTDILLQGVSGTLFMTLFSYCAANAEKEQFREPVLLAKLARRLYPEITEKESLLLGWLLHYSVGCFFTTIYNRLWRKTRLPRSVFTGFMLGGICGFVGIAVWHIVFRFHPRPPRIDLKNYYKQLLIAHLIFGAFAAITNIRKISGALQSKESEDPVLFI
jgi:hypothetical protein